jgi:uncharacterized repeat protein (TIGR01451 family)
VVAGQSVTYRIEVRNIGIIDARRVVVCDPVPAGLTIVRARGARVRDGRACWRIRSLGNERTFHVKARVNRTARGRIANTARARAANARRVRNATRIRVRARGQPDPCPTPSAVGARAARLRC